MGLHSRNQEYRVGIVSRKSYCTRDRRKRLLFLIFKIFYTFINRIFIGSTVVVKE